MWSIKYIRAMNPGKWLFFGCVMVIIGVPMGMYVSRPNARSAKGAAAAEAENRSAQMRPKQDEQRASSPREIGADGKRVLTETNLVTSSSAEISPGQEEAIARLQRDTTLALKDPSSAQFRNLRLRSGNTVLCGEVNSKNKFGGYVGFRPFVTQSRGTVIWNGGCPSYGDIDSQIACLREANAYRLAAVRTGCKSQEEINATLQ